MFKKLPVILYCTFISIQLFAQHQVKNSSLYNEFLNEGWHRNEIKRLMHFQLEDELSVQYKEGKDGAGMLQPKPNLNSDISMFHGGIDFYQANYKRFSQAFPDASSTGGIEKAIDLLPNTKYDREPGQWKHISTYAAVGRIYDLELHPENPEIMYANPDGDGIFRTEDSGRSWNSITDNIPDRLHRDSYENIIVDPSNFDHVFSISRFGMLYETSNGGQSWEKIVNTKHEQGKAPQFKWVEAFQDSNEDLILIGTVTKKNGINHAWEKGVYRSANQGESWEKLSVEDDRLQEMAFHDKQSDVVFLASNSKIYKSIDAGISFELLKDFEFGKQPMFIAISEKQHSDVMYVALSEDGNTQVYFSNDSGDNWELRQDSEKKVGFDKGIFGGSGSSGWTSFFAVDPFDENHLIASNVSSCESFDGGKTWELWNWYKRASARMEDGSLQMAPFSSHNADNHVVKFHPKKKGFMVKGCDAGIMKQEVSDTNWVNINGDMPAFLWYSVVVNEFGDRYISGNTQDNSIQTYRYNKWENDRGYEGDVIFMNPSTNTSYFPVAKTEEGEGLNFLEPGFWKMHSWSHPKVAANYYNLDQFYIAFGRRPTEPEKQLPKYLYVTENRGVSFNRVPNLDDKEVFSVNVSRTAEPVLTVFTATDVRSTVDGGGSWEVKTYPEGFEGKHRSRKVSGCVNPINPSQIWLGGAHGDVYASTDAGETWESIKGSLPDGQVLELLFHEGTKADLYALVKGFGVFYKGADELDWKLWMDGFNLADYSEIRIDYPAQKMLASSYGRGLWQADLEQTVERFFPGGFKIKSQGRGKDTQVFSIDSDLQIPSYYNFSWKINGKDSGINSSRFVAIKLKDGDEVSLEISPIYSPEVSLDANSVVERKSVNEEIVKKEMSSFYKNHFIDASYVDLFNGGQNFTFSTLIKPITEGVIAANRRTYYRDAKGWYLEVTPDGELHFNAAFYQNRSLNKTFDKGLDQSLSVTSEKGIVEFNQWAHVAATINRTGQVALFVNGVKVASESIAELPSELSLNNVFNFSLLADPYGKRKMIGELKYTAIHTRELSSGEIIKMKEKEKISSDGLQFFIDFRKDNNSDVYESFSGRKLQLKGKEYIK